MKKILITIDEHGINELDNIVKKLNDAPEEGGGWNRSRVIRSIIFRTAKEMKCLDTNRNK